MHSQILADLSTEGRHLRKEVFISFEPNTSGPGSSVCKLQIEMEIELWVGAQGDKGPRTANLLDDKRHKEGWCQPGEWTLGRNSRAENC